MMMGQEAKAWGLSRRKTVSWNTESLSSMYKSLISIQQVVVSNSLMPKEDKMINVDVFTDAARWHCAIDVVVLQ